MGVAPTVVVALLLLGTLAVPSLACYSCNPSPSPPPPPPPKPVPCPPPPRPSPPPPSPPPPSPPPPSPPPPSPPPPPKVVPCPPPPSPPPPPKVVPCPPPPPPKPAPCPPPTGTCPVDTLKLGACVDVLGGLVHVIIGQSAKSACCPVLDGVADLDAALCLCTAIKAKLLNVYVVLPLALQVLADCGKHVPYGYQCPAY